jgi:hypothetical protein
MPTKLGRQSVNRRKGSFFYYGYYESNNSIRYYYSSHSTYSKTLSFADPGGSKQCRGGRQKGSRLAGKGGKWKGGGGRVGKLERVGLAPKQEILRNIVEKKGKRERTRKPRIIGYHVKYLGK